MSVGTKTKTAIRNLMVLRKEKSGRKTNVAGWPKRRSKMARLFLAAADLLRQPKVWVQGHYDIRADESDEGVDQFCLVGAIREIDPLSYGVDEDEALEALAKAIKPSYDPDNAEEYPAEALIIDWNDTENRQKRTVIKALERAAEQN